MSIAKLEITSPTPIILNALTCTVLTGLSTDLVNPLIVHVSPSSTLVDPPMASIILP